MLKNKIYLVFALVFFHSCSSFNASNERQPTAAQTQRDKIKISFTGDILIHRPLYESVVNSTDKKFSKLWAKAIPFFQASDYTYANLEGPVALGISYVDWKLADKGDIGFIYDGVVYSGANFLFNYHPNIIDDIKASGIDIVSTANNHQRDRGTIGVDKTVDAMNEKKMNFVGSRKKGETISLYKITQIKNFKVGWISCTEQLNGFKDKDFQTLLCFTQADEIISLIKELKNQQGADIVIVTPHWGEEYKAQPAESQKKHAKIFLEAGADVIMGSHPHVLEPVQQYKTADGRDTFIAYSLGNFVSGQKADMKALPPTATPEEIAYAKVEAERGTIARQASAIVFLEFEKKNNKTVISNYDFQPITFDLNAIQLTIPKNQKILDHINAFMSKKLIPLAH